jgi:hypothetical protein
VAREAETVRLPAGDHLCRAVKVPQIGESRRTLPTTAARSEINFTERQLPSIHQWTSRVADAGFEQNFASGLELG